MPLSDWSEKQILGLTAGVVVGVLLTMGGLVAYTYAKYAKVGTEIDTLKRENKHLQEKADKLEEKNKRLDTLIKNDRVHQKKLPDDEDLGGLRSQVSEQSRNTEIDITSLTKVKERGGKRPGGQSGPGSKRYIPVKMQIEAKGKFHLFGQFLNRLENRIERVVAVTGFELTANEDGMRPREPELAIKLRFDAYCYKSRKKKK